MEQHPAEAEPVHAPERLVGFDLIRAWAFTTVILYHSTWFYWPGEAGCPDRMDTLFSHVIIDIYGRPGSYSGQTLVFITAFLFGLKRRLFAGKTWLPIFLFIGWFVFSLILVWHDGGPFRMAWDVYPLLLVGTVSGTLLYRTESKPLLATVVGRYLPERRLADPAVDLLGLGRHRTGPTVSPDAARAATGVFSHEARRAHRGSGCTRRPGLREHFALDPSPLQRAVRMLCAAPTLADLLGVLRGPARDDASERRS